MLICESLQSSFIAFPLVVDFENISILNTFGNSSDATEPAFRARRENGIRAWILTRHELE